MGRTCERCGVELDSPGADFTVPTVHTDARCAHRLKTRLDEARDELAELRADLGELMRCDYGPQGCMWNGNGENAVAHLRGHLEDLAKTYDSREPELVKALRTQRDEALARAENAERGGEVLADAYKDLRIMMTEENAALRADLARKTEALRQIARVEHGGNFSGARNKDRRIAEAALAEPKAGGEPSKG